YVAVSGTLTFDPVQTRKTIAIPLLNDSVVEGDETLFLTLRNPTGGASLGEPFAVVLTILDEDVGGAAVQASAGGPYTIAEGGTLLLAASIVNGNPTDFAWD